MYVFVCILDYIYILCSNLYIHSSAIRWRPIQGVTRLSALDSWDRLQQTPVTQNWREAGVENGWMNK